MCLALCDRDAQCHYIGGNMECSSFDGGGKKCYCRDERRRASDNGVCGEVSMYYTGQCGKVSLWRSKYVEK